MDLLDHRNKLIKVRIEELESKIRSKRDLYYYLIGFLHPKGKWNWKLPTSKPMSARQAWLSQSYLADIDLEVCNFNFHFKINIIF